ncbi:MAG TPA: recombination mediator RecR [Candidatus Acidoferrum sp.]|nr:recombination mediator RecR [Candidatus Acidoferrum sp.]
MSELTLSYPVLYATLSTDCVCEAFEKNEKIRRYVCFDENLRGNAGVCYTEYMPDFAAPVERLIDELKHLPGIGQKTAQRLAFYILRAAPEDALGLADAIRDAKEKIRECSVCSNITDNDPCLYCTGAHRNKHLICVVEEAHNIMAIEKTRTFAGMYHVLGGSLSPLQGRGPDQLRIKSLIERLKGGTIEEIIMATNPTAEGEATAMYLSKLLKPLGVRVTRIGVGIPVGADLEYADEVTMLKALEGRREL